MSLSSCVEKTLHVLPHYVSFIRRHGDQTVRGWYGVIIRAHVSYTLRWQRVNTKGKSKAHHRWDPLKLRGDQPFTPGSDDLFRTGLTAPVTLRQPPRATRLLSPGINSISRDSRSMSPVFTYDWTSHIAVHPIRSGAATHPFILRWSTLRSRKYLRWNISLIRENKLIMKIPQKSSIKLVWRFPKEYLLYKLHQTTYIDWIQIVNHASLSVCPALNF